MSIKKTLLAFAAMALAMGAFASAAMAEDAKIYHTTTNEPIPAGTQLHFEGTAEFNTLGTGIHCEEVTALVEMSTPSTGEVIAFEPTKKSCEGFGFIYAGCTVEETSTTLEESHVTVTADEGEKPADIDVTGFTEIFAEHNAECAVPTTKLEFEEPITVRAFNTEGETVSTNEPIAGIEFETEGTATNAFGTFTVAANAHLPATPEEQCTYEIRA